VERYDQGRDYWVICKRYNEWRERNPGIKAVAVADMKALQQRNQSRAVGLRISTFIARNQSPLPGNNGGNDGPRYA
jgi:hypothetical protein